MKLSSSASTSSRNAGGGRIVVRTHVSEVAFEEMSATYPLKLLSPRMGDNDVAVTYMISYGGGLVGGDHIELSVDVGAATRLVLLSQGSTKVFKTRPGRRAATPARASSPGWHDDAVTTQRLDAQIADTGALFLLPDPVTCFRHAAYRQVQTFRLTGNASIVLLDWLTSGRRALGEEWAFSQYYSLNELFVDGKRIARDAQLLEGDPVNIAPLPERSLRDRMGPYSCYANVLLYGPSAEGVINDLDARYRAISVFKRAEPMDVLWSLSPLTGDAGRVLRVAGKETEDVKVWLRDALRGLENVIGMDVYRKAFV
ncbi:hypothetical protein EWM64_g1192 [Hericium alpestre]|uniref:Urease accessory protein UreD n=1 Tax=Hericium alpestre TaxID=135208 RepID=A0A4Z0A978_9AGAM|nr:hypothetical protein EWM64_g1192 [Hericium alpestre]